MKTYIYILMASLFFAVSCQNDTQKSNESSAEVEVEVVEILPVELINFSDNAETLIGKQIALNGMIDHVCKHGGQKMFITNQDADARIKIVTGEDMAAFNTELEGETVYVVGEVDELRIDEDYLKEWEEEVLAGITADEGEKSEKVHMGDGGEHEENADLKQIEKYRQKIAESGKDYISFFSIVCIDYEVVENDTEEGV